MQLGADELPRKRRAEGALDAPPLPGPAGAAGRHPGVLASLFPAALVTPAGTEPSWMRGEADGGARVGKRTERDEIGRKMRRLGGVPGLR